MPTATQLSRYSARPPRRHEDPHSIFASPGQYLPSSRIPTYSRRRYRRLDQRRILGDDLAVQPVQSLELACDGYGYNTRCRLLALAEHVETTRV